jgi:proteic killer suppression protein
MILSFANHPTENVYHGKQSRQARAICPLEIWGVTRRKLGYLNSATRLDDLRMPPGNRLHALKRKRAGQHAISINDQYRICFRWTAAGPEKVEITDYHDD